MKIGIPVLAALVVLVGSASAQEEETETESVNMEIGMPGMPAPMNMNVKVKTTKTTTTTREVGPAPAPAPAPARATDCGAGEDVGCTMQRQGNYPMDRESFRAFLDSMRSNPNEISREEIAETTLKNEFLTAKQLGLVLDLFNNEITRYEVAEHAAPHVVNPKHAMGLSSKFKNSIHATDFSKLMASQR